MPKGKAHNARKPECNFCECFSHAWSPTQSWGVVLVDVGDAHLLMDYIWTMAGPHGRSFYAGSRSFPRSNARANCQKTNLHQAVFPDRSLLDHKNSNGLDCRQNNLREATHQQNSQNRRSEAGSSSKYIGVHWNKRERKFKSSIYVGKKLLHLGYFKLEEDAALAWNFAAYEHFGEFAKLNQAARPT